MPAAPITQPSGSRGTRSLAQGPREGRIVAALLGLALLALWTWWARSDGAFFGVVLLPGAIGLYLVLIVAVGIARLPIAPRGPHAIALAALLALAAWTALSLLWTPSRELALDYAQRSFAYAGAFLAGLAFTVALRRRMMLSLAPFLIAGGIVAAIVVVKLLTTSALGDVVDLDGQLDFPFGYRNANAGYFAMVAFATMPLIARAPSGIALRAAAAALGGLGLALAAISQSRGSLLGVAAGAIVLLLVSPHRGRALLALVVVVAPVAVVLGELLDPFEAARTSAALPELRQGAWFALGAGAVAGLLAAGAGLLERQGLRVPLPRASRRSALVGSLAALAAAIAAVIVLFGNPLAEVADQIDRASSGNSSYDRIEGSRFTYIGGLNRVNFWEVALEQAGDDPLRGGGAGSFRSAYLVDGNGTEAPRNAHSLPLEMLGELGVVGLLLLLLALGAAVVGAWRSRRLGPDAATLSAAALVVAAVALAQAAVDWSWFFGGQMAPALALLGSAAGPAALALSPLRRGVRLTAATVAALLALIAVPSFISERLTLDAAQGWRSGVDGAYGALATASDLNPLASTPLLVEAEIAKQTNDPDRALAALDEAVKRSPSDWRGYMLGAEVLAPIDPAAARKRAREASALNPSSDEASKLRRRLAEHRG